MLAAPLAIHPVVGAHHRTGAGLHAGAELRQVELVQHPWAGLHIHHETGAVDRIEGEMLHAGDGVALQPPGHRRPQLPHVQRVFAIALLGAAPARVAQQVDAHRRHPVGAKGAGLPGDRCTDLFLQLRIPAGPAGDRRRKRGGAALQHHPPGAIHEVQTWQSQAWHQAGGPGVAVGGIPQGDVRHARPEGGGAAEQAQLFGAAELLQQGFGPGGGGGQGGVHPRNLWICWGDSARWGTVAAVLRWCFSCPAGRQWW